MKPSTIRVLLWLAWGWIAICCAPGAARGDGGALRLSEERGGYRISVFTAPTPIRAGDVDISVLVQEASTGAARPDLPVALQLGRPGRNPLDYPATPEGATNKLFRAALCHIPAPGLWDLRVRVDGEHGPVVIRGELEAASALPLWREMWPWFGWPFAVIALFGLRARRRGIKSAAQGS